MWMMMMMMMMTMMITSLHDAPAATNVFIGILFNGLATNFRTGVSLSFTSRLNSNELRTGKIWRPGKLHARQCMFRIKTDFVSKAISPVL
jgi:hypothetical protein